MKRFLFILAIIMPLCTQAQKPATIPEVNQWIPADGQTRLSRRIIYKSKDLQDIATILCNEYNATILSIDQQNAHFSAVKGTSPKAGDIVLAIKPDKKANLEAYTLNIGQYVEITASSPQGVRWGIQTLLQMQDKNLDVPKGRIIDAPQYKLRGFLIDCGRKFFPMAYMKQLVRVMSYYKMNTLQVHLNDNGFNYYFNNDWSKTPSAFRLESDYFPGLTATDGSYSKQEFRDFIKFAAKLGVEVIPEIDVPAHSLAFTKYRPSLARPEFGMDHLDITKPEVTLFIDSLFTEYCSGTDPVFCCPKVHIGTDEFNNSKPEFREAFRALTDHLIKHVESFGKQAVAWGSLSHAYGNTPVKVDNVLLSMWSNGFADPKAMKEAGYEMISIPDGYVYIVPAAGYYYNYLNCEWLYNTWTPANIGGVLFEENDPAIRGGMFAVWNDHPGNGITVQDVHHRVFPAMQTISAKTWSGNKVERQWQDFQNLMATCEEAPGVDILSRTINTIRLEDKDGLKPEQCNMATTDLCYPYEITFTIDCRPEERGATLMESPNARFYLSDPQTGSVGFEREGYISTFGYRLPQSGQITLTIKADNQSTELWVDGKLKKRLEQETLYVLNPNPANTVRTLPGSGAIVPDASVPYKKMYYQHTLFFPLQRAGRFNSRLLTIEAKRL